MIILQFSQVQVAENIFLLCQCWFKLKSCNQKITRKLDFSHSINSNKLPLSNTSLTTLDIAFMLLVVNNWI